MATMKMIMVVVVFFNFYFPASFAPLANNLHSGNPPEKVEVKQVDEFNSSVTGGGVGALNQSTFPVLREGGGGEGGEGGIGGGGDEEGEEEGGYGVGGWSNAVYGGGPTGEPNNDNGAAGICIRKDVVLIGAATALLLLHISM